MRKTLIWIQQEFSEFRYLRVPTVTEFQLCKQIKKMGNRSCNHLMALSVMNKSTRDQLIQDFLIQILIFTDLIYQLIFFSFRHTKHKPISLSFPTCRYLWVLIMTTWQCELKIISFYCQNKNDSFILCSTLLVSAGSCIPNTCNQGGYLLVDKLCNINTPVSSLLLKISFINHHKSLHRYIDK